MIFPHKFPIAKRCQDVHLAHIAPQEQKSEGGSERIQRFIKEVSGMTNNSDYGGSLRRPAPELHPIRKPFIIAGLCGLGDADATTCGFMNIFSEYYFSIHRLQHIIHTHHSRLIHSNITEWSGSIFFRQKYDLPHALRIYSRFYLMLLDFVLF